MMTHDELLRRSIDAAFFGDFALAFGVSEKKGDTRRPGVDDYGADRGGDEFDDSDSDASEVLHEPEAELVGTDDLVDVDVVPREGDPKDAA